MSAPPVPTIFTPIAPFSFTLGTGNALRKAKSVQNCSACRRRKTKCDRLWPCTPCKDRGEAKLCEQYIKEPNDRPTGYTHVLDTSILANRVAQLEAVLSRLLTRVDNPEAYQDLLADWKDPLPVYKLNKDDGHPAKRERNDPGSKHAEASDDGMEIDRPGTSTTADHKPGPVAAAAAAPPPPPPGSSTTPNSQACQPLNLTPGSGSLPMLGSMSANPAPLTRQSPLQPTLVDATATANLYTANSTSQSMNLPYLADNEPWIAFDRAQPSFLNPLSNPTHNPTLGGISSMGGTEPASKAPSAHEHDAALALEGMALGRDTVLPPSNRPTVMDNDEPTPGSPLTFSSFIQHKRSIKATAGYKAFPSVTKLPSIIVGKYVINHFLEHVDFRWRCLHRPTFEAQYNQLSNRLRLKSVDFTRDELSTLALYATCLAVGIHFLDEEGYRDLSMTEEQAEDLAATCWQVSYEALEASDWMQIHDIRSCQTIIIAGIFLSSVRRANQHWTLLGSATKVAMALGLANVPDEAGVIAGKRIPHRWTNTIDREVARRVWYCLLELDWLFSMEYGFLYLISSEIHQTTEPANVNDVDIRPNEPVVSRPREEYTDMSYFLQRLKLFYPFQTVVQKARKAGRMRYAFVIEANEELQNAIASSPAFYRQTEAADTVDAHQLYRLKREGLALMEGADLRLMRLHRYYFSEACVNPRYLLSKQVCLNSARRLLEIKDRPAGSNYYTNAHYWAHTYCIFAATMVTIIYLSYALPQELEDMKSYTQSGIQQLRNLSRRRRTDLGETADTLESLMNVQLARRAEPTEPAELKRAISDLDGDAWEGWLPPDLVALARLNPAFQMGGHGANSGNDAGGSGTAHTGDAQTPMAPPLPEGLFFEHLLDDLQFNESNFIM